MNSRKIAGKSGPKDNQGAGLIPSFRSNLYLDSWSGNFLACKSTFWWWGGGGGVATGLGKLAKPAHHVVLENTLRIQDQSCPMRRLSHNAMWLHTQHVVRMSCI